MTPIPGRVLRGTKLVLDIEDMAQLAHDLSRLHELTVATDIEGTQVRIPTAADCEQTIRYLLAECQPAGNLSTGAFRVVKHRDGADVFYHLGSIFREGAWMPERKVQG